MKSKKIPTYLKYYLSKTRLDGLVFNKTYIENLSGTSFYLDHSVEDKIKINFKASESTQDSIPTPENPQDIHVVKGDNEVVIENKNLFDGILETGGISNVTGINDDTDVTLIRSKNYITVNANVNYVVSSPNVANTSKVALRFYDNNKNFLGNGTTDFFPNSFTTPANCSYLRIVITGSQPITTKIQIEKGTTATSYVEHKEQNYPLSLNNLEMCKINNYADEFFKNVPECEYYDNTLEYGKWYKYGRIGKAILDGSENWIKEYDRTTTFVAKTFINTIKNIGNIVGLDIKSTHFAAKDVYNYDQEGIEHIAQQILISINRSSLSTEDLNGFKDWLSTNNDTLYYILEIPAKTLLSDTLQEQLENIYNNAHTYDKITNINQVNEDRPFILDITYYRKVK